MARFTITLPESIAAKLAVDEELRKIPRSTLIADYLKQHYVDAEKPKAFLATSKKALYGV